MNAFPLVVIGLYAVATLPTGYSVVLKKANGSHCEIGLL